jgi:hypothetical protein
MMKITGLDVALFSVELRPIRRKGASCSVKLTVAKPEKARPSSAHVSNSRAGPSEGKYSPPGVGPGHRQGRRGSYRKFVKQQKCPLEGQGTKINTAARPDVTRKTVLRKEALQREEKRTGGWMSPSGRSKEKN